VIPMDMFDNIDKNGNKEGSNKQQQQRISNTITIRTSARQRHSVGTAAVEGGAGFVDEIKMDESISIKKHQLID
jgi:hypothetical protein